MNIGKAGCFIQIGHNCTVRSGLNELSDNSNFDFTKEMPLGRLVVGRISKVDSPPSGDKRFHFSIRPSLIVYGVGGVERSKLEVGQQVESIVMAMADGKAFSQIKGSYIKIKVKGAGTEKLKVGNHVISELKKVTKEKISSEIVKKVVGTTSTAEEQEEEFRAQALLDSVQEEVEKSLEALNELNKDVE